MNRISWIIIFEKKIAFQNFSTCLYTFRKVQNNFAFQQVSFFEEA